eukprot:CAMPEP_0176326606 /NCGR_PEP_ID=MMETSP0121_2-20121125/74013_1 /TAXON_ID=160619 /ORGANISM="Kryptoperidinium foliaceum, Strain CCMP 1326" /LENGTH=169 /DNA_ID=CAMNT_0017669209 /DNA_START=10 /DNA_END=516 /DNA_ORIENTATION=+
MNEEDPNAFMKDWSPVRILLHNILTHTDKRTGTIVFDAVMGVIIIGNIFIMIPETDIAASCEFDDPEACIPTWIVASDYILLTIYAIELSMRMLAYRAACFKSKWVILDMIIVGVGILGILLADIQELKRDEHPPDPPGGAHPALHPHPQALPDALQHHRRLRGRDAGH